MSRRERKSPYQTRAARLEKFGFASYSDYLRSDHWRDLKHRFYASKLYHGHCDVCFRSLPLEIHHKSYKRLGAERLHDLIAVCRGCHEATHERHRTDSRTSLWKAHNKLRKRNLKVIRMERAVAQSRATKAANRLDRLIERIPRFISPPQPVARVGNFDQMGDGRLIYRPV